MYINYNWKMSETIFKKNRGTVFSCFACGGGSSFGYKLAGFDVIGANDIDPKMAEVYKLNHNPKYFYNESIVDMANRDEFPPELYNLDILDGSPPCSSFSMLGNREKDWGKEKKFKEGQSKQVLDTLFFDFILLAKKLCPKVVIAENVEGLMHGSAINYVRRIYDAFDEAGYYCQHFLLNASDMGIPQKRKRVFFICLRKDLSEKFLYLRDIFTTVPKINIRFNEKKITFSEVFRDYTDRPLTEHYMKFWNERVYGDLDFSASSERMGKNKNAQFQYKYLYMNKVPNTITSGDTCVLFDRPRLRNFDELCECGSFPKDYNFLNVKPQYLIGMSVPPLMTAKIANEVFNQWLNKL